MSHVHRRDIATLSAIALAAIALDTASRGADGGTSLQMVDSQWIALPSPRTASAVSLEAALSRRRSIRTLRPDAIDAATLGQLLWAAQGITSADGLRTAPSAGALYPLEIYVATADGLYHYRPDGHRLGLHRAGDQRAALRAAAHGEGVIGEAAAVFVIAGVDARTAAKYGADRARRYVDLEAGHAAQNLLLQATALGLGAVPVGAFSDDAVARVAGLGPEERPLYLVPVGRVRR